MTSPRAFNKDEKRSLWQVHRELRDLRVGPMLSPQLVDAARLAMSESDMTHWGTAGTINWSLQRILDSGRYPRFVDLLLDHGGAVLACHANGDGDAGNGRDSAGRQEGGLSSTRSGRNSRGPLRHIAVEFDGPFHFMSNDINHMNGRTALRNRVYERHFNGKGNVVSVTIAEWVKVNRNGGPKEDEIWAREQFLAQKLGLGRWCAVLTVKGLTSCTPLLTVSQVRAQSPHLEALFVWLCLSWDL